jgi:hypothetical protein
MWEFGKTTIRPCGVATLPMGIVSFFDELLDHAGATLIDVPEQESRPSSTV